MEDLKSQGLGSVEDLRLGTEYRGTLHCRGLVVKVRPLCIAEDIDITNQVIAEIMRLPEAQRTAMTEARMLACYTLEKASTSDMDKTDYGITRAVLARITADELQYLFKQYQDMLDKVNPALERMPAEKLDHLVAEVKKNPSELIRLSRWQLCQMVDSLLPKEDD